METYRRAQAEEARLWQRVGHLGPDRAGAEWQRWLEAVEASRAALDEVQWRGLRGEPGHS
jgi:hypothetical protein